MYKHYTTRKCLIGVNPNRAACFISDLFEGDIGDVTLFSQCGVLNYTNTGDSLLVDKGITVLDSTSSNCFFSPFPGKCAAFTKEVLLTKRITKGRLYLKRYDEQSKKSSGVLPVTTYFFSKFVSL